MPAPNENLFNILDENIKKTLSPPTGQCSLKKTE